MLLTDTIKSRALKVDAAEALTGFNLGASGSLSAIADAAKRPEQTVNPPANFVHELQK